MQTFAKTKETYTNENASKNEKTSAKMDDVMW